MRETIGISMNKLPRKLFVRLSPETTAKDHRVKTCVIVTMKWCRSLCTSMPTYRQTKQNLSTNADENEEHNRKVNRQRRSFRMKTNAPQVMAVETVKQPTHRVLSELVMVQISLHVCH